MAGSLSDEDIAKFDASQNGKAHLNDEDISKFDELAKASPSKESKPSEPQYIKPMTNYVLEGLGIAMSPLAKAAGWVNEKVIDPYTAAPIRAMVGEAQKDNSTLASIAKTGYDQFGADPKLAPTNAQLAEKMGIPNRDIEIFPWEKALYAPEDRTTINPANIAGQVIGLGTQPLNILSTAFAPEIAAGASKLYGKAGELAAQAAEHAPDTLAVPGAFIGGKLAKALDASHIEGIAAGTYVGSKIPTAPIIEGASKIGGAVGDALEAISRRLNSPESLQMLRGGQAEISTIPNFPTQTQVKTSLGIK